MKRIVYILILITGFANAQIVNIPDANFKNKLVNTLCVDTDGDGLVDTDVDTDNDGEIQNSEAQAVLNLNISFPNFTPISEQISDLTGINSFINLQKLQCMENNISTINLTPLINLTYLDCENNNLTSLNLIGLTNLTYLSFLGNTIDNLDLSTCINLTTIICGNVINTLDLSNTPIESIDFNDVTTISYLNLSNCTQLNLLNTYNSVNLQSINLTGCTSMTALNVENCGLTSIDVSTLVNLQVFTCSLNQIVSLDVSNNHNLISLEFMSDSIQYLYAKNGTDENIVNQISGSPNLVYACVDDLQLSPLMSLSSNTMFSSYCTFTPGGNYNTIVGQVQFDEDNNGCEINGAGLPNVRINIADTTLIGATFTNANGGYTFYSQALNHELFVATENPTWFTVSPELASVSFDEINNNQALQNFCITANGVHPDLEIVITPTVPARPGFDATYKIVYRNKGNQTLSQQYGINFFYNQNLMEYVSASVEPSQMAVGGISWDYANLQPFESREIVFTLNINAPTEDINPVNNGDVLTFTTSIMPQAGDENTADNTFLLNQIVVGSYDPNDITCLEGDIVSPTEIGEYLHYNIRFENTGTAAAENIVVKTEINPAEFDINTLQLLNSSHAVDARIRENIVEFIFKEIYLQTGGHGNVLLKVKTKPSLQIGDLVKNKANIYFDYNFPILTNDAETVFQSLSNPDFEVDNSVKIYPNPSNAIVNIKSDFNIKSIQLYDVQGRILQTNIVEESTTSLDIASKAKGIYFLKIITDKGIKVEKLVKE